MTTFVSCFVEIYDTPFNSRTHEWRINNFLKIARTGIQIALYTCDKTRPAMEEVLSKERENIDTTLNVNLMQIRDNKTFKDMFLYEHSLKYNDRPDVIRSGKDTLEFLALMHNKIEFVRETIEQNPWDSTVFAWIDFNIAHVLHDEKKIVEILKQMGKTQFVERFFTMPGCWHDNIEDNIEYVLNKVHWRFCGGFFMGDGQTLLDFYDLYKKYYVIFMETHKKVIWEVNFWKWLESFSGSKWRPIWYKADHNDSILEISADVISKSFNDLQPIRVRMKIEYPVIERFLPTSASYLYHKGNHLLNTRYVNYWCNPCGSYNFNDSDRIIRNKNIISILDAELIPLTFQEMDGDTIEGLEKASGHTFSEGLEDVRLYSDQDKVCFIASTVNYGRNGKIEMITGTYDIATLKFINCKMIESPNNHHMEKNWIPVIRKNNRIEITLKEEKEEEEKEKEGNEKEGNEKEGNEGKEEYEELFIYRWYPFELGKINHTTNKLDIVESVHHSTPFFNKVRGSTIFVQSSENDNELIGVVHFSEEKWPRHYSHLLVTLDKESLRPIRYTEPFYFNNKSVEFCIGFTLVDSCYCFWISNFDRDPEAIKIEMNSFTKWYDCIY